jgi:iron(III) transport system substrate-binding protein
MLVGVTMAACGDDDGDTTTGDTGAVTTATSGDGATTTAAGETATTAASAGTSLDDLYAAAQEEPQLVVYSSQAPDPLAKIAADFEAAYPGVDVEAIRGIDGDLIPKVETEHQTGQVVASMFITASPSWVIPKAEEGGWFIAPDGPELLGEGDYDAAQYVHEGNYFEVGAAVLSFGWNSDLYEPGIEDYPDLLDPELQGRLGVPEPSSPSIVDFYLWMEETFGEQYVEDLAAQEPQIYASAVAIGEALAAGEVAASPYIAPSTLIPLADQGAPVDFGISPEGAWGARYFGVILEGAPAPNAAQLFANYMVTEAGQAAVMVNAGSVLADVEGTLISNDQVREQDISKLTPEAVTAYQEKWNGLFR